MKSSAHFAGRLALQQRVLPSYRVAFFDLLASRCTEGLSLYAGKPRGSEAIQTAESLNEARLWPAHNLHLLGGPLYLCLQRDIMEWIQDWDPQALILEANPRYPSSRRAVDWMHAKGRPVIGWGLGLGRAVARWKSYLSRFDALIAYSTQGAEGYRRAGFPAERVFTAPNAMTGPPPELHPRKVSKPPRVLFVGRLQERKRVDFLLKACRAQRMELELWIVGDGPARTRLERMAAQEYPRAQFTGAQYGEELEGIFRQADLFVLPGTGGLAVQQAMAYALPVIVAEADGSQRDLVGTDNGWLVPPGDLEALTGALRSALENPDRLPQMGAASHRIVAERVNIEVMMDIFLEAVNQVRPA
ncbi:MAG: glycosyltransferase family 4 protein [Anaerolineales bacterium]